MKKLVFLLVAIVVMKFVASCKNTCQVNGDVVDRYDTICLCDSSSVDSLLNTNY